MSDTSSIEWTDATWNPVRGCSVVSPGCTNCYAMKQANRFSGAGQAYEGLTTLTKGGPVWTGNVRLVPELLDWPLRKRKPLRIFVNSMSDLFHEDVPDEFIGAVFGAMANCRRHTFQILTKRPERMLRWFEWVTQRDGPPDYEEGGEEHGCACMYGDAIGRMERDLRERSLREYADYLYAKGKQHSEEFAGWTWPLPNVWLGVSVEDQARADERIPLLLQTPAAVRFLSVEPLLGPVNLMEIPDPLYPGRTLHPLSRPRDCRIFWPVDWVIVGGESGPGSRECRVEWIRNVVEQCRAARVPVFVKQLGSVVIDRNDAGFDGVENEWPDGTETRDWLKYKAEYQGAPVRVLLRDRKGGDMEEWPRDLRVREFPS